MRLANESHLAYCTNVHPGNDWEQTRHSLEQQTMAVRQRVCPDEPFAIGLRLSARAAAELARPQELAAFRRWLDSVNCYVFSINGFPYGNFHGERVKEQVYLPDWTSPERLDYTLQLFNLLAQLLPSGIRSGSVSTLPGSFKRFIDSKEKSQAIYENLNRCFQRIEALSERRDLDLHLGLEPEPLGLFETSKETVAFFDRFLIDRSDEESILRRIGVNYDTCHLAVEFESAHEALLRLKRSGIRISKIHLSAALALPRPDPARAAALRPFGEDTYLHQVLARQGKAIVERYEDLAPALDALDRGQIGHDEWRIHFHIPLHAEPEPPLQSTREHLLAALDLLGEQPGLCQHLEMETYTWAVLPENLRKSDVVEQLALEYEWLLPQLAQRGLR